MWPDRPKIILHVASKSSLYQANFARNYRSEFLSDLDRDTALEGTNAELTDDPHPQVTLCVHIRHKNNIFRMVCVLCAICVQIIFVTYVWIRFVKYWQFPVKYAERHERSSTELAQFPVSDTTFWWVSEEDKPLRCTFPTVGKLFLTATVNFEHFCFSRFLIIKVFPCKCWMNFWTFRNFWCWEVSNAFPGENTAENNFSKPSPGASLHSDIATTSTLLE